MIAQIKHLASLPENQRAAVLSLFSAEEQAVILKQVEALAPKLDRHRKRARRLAEAGDPERYLAETFGYRLYDDTRKLLYAMQEHRWILGIGGHATGKTFLGGAMILGWDWDAMGSLPAEDGGCQGCLLVLTAPKAQKIMDTSYVSYRKHASQALRHSGHEIAGSKTASKASVNWKADPDRWYMVSETPQNVAASSKDQVAHSGAGHHHINLVVHVEEAMAVAPSMFATMEGWGPRKVVAFLNPTHAGGSIYALAESGAWHVVDLSSLRHPNVLERRVVIPGCVTHHDVERRLRLPGHARRLGRCDEIDPDPKFKDFVYALPDPKQPDAEGPRPDGFPGHPEATPLVWRPSPKCCGQDLGVWPPASTSGLFDPMAWTDAVERWGQRVIPSCAPDVVGVDSADDGPDPIACTPRWGRSARDVFERYVLDLSEGAASPESVLVCPRCEGVEPERCPLCEDGVFRTVLGEPRNAPKGTGDEIADFLLSSWPVERVGGRVVRPVFVIDKSAGMRICEALERRGVDYRPVSFGGSPDEAVPGQQQAMNKRASMFGNFSDAVNHGLVDVPPSDALRSQTILLEREIVYRSAEPQWKVQEKVKIKAALGGQSPDDADSAALALDDGAVLMRGIW